MVFEGLQRVVTTEAEAGDIVLVTGIDAIGIGVTLCDAATTVPLPPIAVDEPTLTMNFQVNTSPFAGREGKYVTSRNLRERLQRELMSNVALRVQDTVDADVFLVSGRGELHLTILLENMRREGYEMAVSRPRVVIREIDGEKREPYELLDRRRRGSAIRAPSWKSSAAAEASCRTCSLTARAAFDSTTAFRRAA